MTLQNPSKHPWVKVLQQALRDKGYTIAVDGDFGPKTEAVVKQFQRASSLDVDGIVGKSTWAMLKMGSWFKDDQALQDMPAAPCRKIPLPGDHLGDDVTSTWNRWGLVLETISEQLSIHPALMVAVLAVESGGHSFSRHGTVIRFENHIFHSITSDKTWARKHFSFSQSEPWKKHAWHDGDNAWRWTHVTGGGINDFQQEHEWNAFNFAASHDRLAAVQSISMGLAQIMGFNYLRIGYPNPEEMFKAMNSSERLQLFSLFDYIVGPEPESDQVKDLQKEDLVGFARQYNGPGQAEHYANLIKARFNRAKELGIGG